LKKLTKLSLILLVVFGVLCLPGFWLWKQGTPYQQPFWSPNGQYYVQKYSNLTFSKLMPVMPGQGSDTIDGYIRLYRKDGTLLHERFAPFIRDVEPVWAGEKVFLMGVDEIDNDPWILTTSAD
jgi:hypothetical protein